MRGNERKARNSMRTGSEHKMQNFDESGESVKNPRHFHITSFDRNAKKHESREISAYGSREIDYRIEMLKYN